MLTTKQVYQLIDEFNFWAYRQGLLFEEKYLIDKYLDKNLKTVEAGTAGGRILLEMANEGFTSLYGYDYIADFITEAKKKDSKNQVVFAIEDATKLNYPDEHFPQIIYLQQIISLIDGDEPTLKALKEAYRIMTSGGTALFSFLCFEVRAQSLMYKTYLKYLHLLRKLQEKNLSIQNLPWLKLGKKWNLSALLDRGPYIYWYRLSEIDQILKSLGFKIIAVGSSYQIERDSMCLNVAELSGQALTGMLYFVCTK